MPAGENAKGKQPQQWPIGITGQLEDDANDGFIIDPFKYEYT